MKIANWKDKLLTCGILLICVTVFWIFQIPCFFNALFGIPCPGCGMTRAFVNVIKLDFVGAFEMHAMFWSMPILLGYYLKDWHLFKNKWINIGVISLIGIGFLINWIVL